MANSSFNPVRLLIVLGLLGFTGWYFYGGGVEQKVVDETIQEYRIVKRTGRRNDICMAAMSVSAAYLQAQDDENYRKWKQIEDSDCAAAGMTVPSR
jgi:hypothetical protein